jgi:cyclohexanone monooxygenase
MQWTGRRHLASQVKDSNLRDRVTPDYRIGCKRVLMSDDWYPALQRSNVELVTDPIVGINAGGVVVEGASGVESADGHSDGQRQIDVDTIVLATGFRVQRRAILSRIVGTSGDSMAAAMFRSAPTAFLGSTVPGFPNLILMTGPNTGLANNSMIVMIEAQARYASDMAARITRGAAAGRSVVIDLRSTAFKRFAAEIESRLATSVWANSNCSSWYQDPVGRVTALWPGTTSEFRRRTRALDERHYSIISEPNR